MGGFYYQVLRAGYESFLAPRVCAPEDENYRVFTLVELADNLIGQDFPAFALVGISLSAADGEHCIEEQNSLLSPRSQVSGIRRRDSKVGLKLFIDIL